MTIFYCEDNFAAKMTCIYDAWASGLGHENVRLQLEPISQLSFLEDYVYVEADKEKTEKVIRSIQNKISSMAYLWVYYAALSTEEDSLDAIYRFLIKGFQCGAKICDMLQDPAVIRMHEIKRAVSNEAHSFREFVRFISLDHQVYVAHIEPKSNVILYVAEYFENRMPSENFMILDDGRRIAVVHPKDEPMYIRELSEEEFSRVKEQEEGIPDPFESYWKEYFDSIAIKERTNPACQRNHFPLWKRKHVTEFQ